jgi:hypothetical protein|uniref:PBCV-specific basic adaptor domain-containing protein n=1 Tax=Virus NIOZ-UU159 TaxID=2763270 RepID=A0A7S9SUP8_9VIRU|nr:MAG: hypothetical protein NIOZUU159_00265 [Virus NIOZ-UU159]
MVQEEFMEYEGGSVKVYTGPKNGKFIINRKGKKVYLNRKSLSENVKYTPNKSKKKSVKK